MSKIIEKTIIGKLKNKLASFKSLKKEILYTEAKFSQENIVQYQEYSLLIHLISILLWNMEKLDKEFDFKSRENECLHILNKKIKFLQEEMNNATKEYKNPQSQQIIKGEMNIQLSFLFQFVYNINNEL